MTNIEPTPTEMHDDVRQLAETVWDAMLQLPIALLAEDPTCKPESMTATVRITGSWAGEVTVGYDRSFAVRAASILFGLSDSVVTEAEENDAMGELVNMIGGNVKALLPQPCALSLPCVGSLDPSHQHEAALLARVPLDCEGERIVVSVSKLRAA